MPTLLMFFLSLLPFANPGFDDELKEMDNNNNKFERQQQLHHSFQERLKE
jgi:hypothetical protein